MSISDSRTDKERYEIASKLSQALGAILFPLTYLASHPSLGWLDIEGLRPVALFLFVIGNTLALEAMQTPDE